jgi:hypothetical protein
MRSSKPAKTPPWCYAPLDDRRQLLKDSTRQRMVGVEFNYPRTEIETRILQQEAGITFELAEALVQLAQAIRRLETPGLREVASTRVLVAAGRLITEGLTPRNAARAAIAPPLSDDTTVQAGLQQMIDTYPPLTASICVNHQVPRPALRRRLVVRDGIVVASDHLEVKII